jgi:hypothetical protein
MCVLERFCRFGVSAVIVGLISVPTAGFAQDRVGGPTLDASPQTKTAVANSLRISEAVPRAVRAALAQDSAGSATTAQVPADRSWIARHPALVGLMAGAGAGAAIGYGLGQECTGNEIEPCSSKAGAAVAGAAIFGGIGAFTGWLISQATK